MLSAATDDLGLNVYESSESGGFRVLKRVFDGGVGGRKLSLGLASWKSVPLICCCVWGRRWEAGLRNDLCIGMRTAEAGTDEEALWLGPDGVEEGSGEGIRREKKSNSWTKRGCGPLDHVSKLPSTTPTTPLCRLSRDPNANFIPGHSWTSWWVGGRGSYLQTCFLGSFTLAFKLTHCWRSN